jgi:hypothetical protein
VKRNYEVTYRALHEVHSNVSRIISNEDCERVQDLTKDEEELEACLARALELSDQLREDE